MFFLAVVIVVGIVLVVVKVLSKLNCINLGPIVSADFALMPVFVIGQNAWTSLIIHNQRSGKFERERAHNKRRKGQNRPSSVDNTRFSDVEK